MQIKSDYLPAHFIQQKWLPIYLITGDVPLLVEEAKYALREAAHQAGFNQRHSLMIEAGFNWSKFYHLAHNLNLFGDKQLIELQDPHAKIDESGKKILLDYLDKPAQDIIVVLITSKLNNQQQKAKWLKRIDQIGGIITIWPIATHELPQWIKNRFTKAGLSVNLPTIHLLADLTAGNLFATVQAIEKLQLLYPNQFIEEKHVLTVICDSAKFNVFDLIHEALLGKITTVIRILNNLEQEGIEPTLVLWALTREVRHLLELMAEQEAGMVLTQVLANEWASRKKGLQAALTRHSTQSLLGLLQIAHTVDQTIKGIEVRNSWDLLLQLTIGLARRGNLYVNH